MGWKFGTTTIFHSHMSTKCSHKIMVCPGYFAFEGASVDDGEHLEVFTLSLPAALEWIREGKITDNKTVSGLFLAEKLLCGEW